LVLISFTPRPPHHHDYQDAASAKQGRPPLHAVMRYESTTNRRLRDPSHAQELAVEAVRHIQGVLPQAPDPDPQRAHPAAYRVVLGLGPGRSGTKSLTELLGAQTACVHSEHEMVVARRYRRDETGRIDPTRIVEQEQTSSSNSSGVTSGSDTSSARGGNGDILRDKTSKRNATKKKKEKKKKGSWGSDRRMEWDAPRLVRGAPPLTEQEEASWRVLRVLEQRYAFDEWMLQYSKDDNLLAYKPRKLGARGWRKHNNGGGGNEGIAFFESEGDNDVTSDHVAVPVVAAVSSVGLAYLHEYIALDPGIRIVVLMRPREEVVDSFLKKSKGRNHWQRHERRRRNPQDQRSSAKVAENVQPDKTWDSAFPNMSVDECLPFISAASSDSGNDDAVQEDTAWTPDKATAIRAYWELYNEISHKLCQQYPSNIRTFDMHDALNDSLVQKDLLLFCGFDEPLLDTSSAVHLNKKMK